MLTSCLSCCSWSVNAMGSLEISLTFLFNVL